MRSKVFIFVIIALLLSCSRSPEQDINKAIDAVRKGNADCVLVCLNGESFIEKGRGLSPILTMYDLHADAMNGAFVIDKVVGRAAAMVAINGRARFVYGELISEDAVELLKKHNVEVRYSNLVHRILNRNRDGLCPLEQSVLGVDDPQEALSLIRKRLQELSLGNQK